MKRGVVVFLGPSCDLAAAREILDADYRPPAKRGDITRAVEDGARVIGLIDGVFFQDCAVAHREVLAALRAGVRVVGASSMGALRAAELDSLGMEGVGEIDPGLSGWEARRRRRGGASFRPRDVCAALGAAREHPGDNSAGA